MFVIMEKRPHKTHNLTGFVQNSKFVACNPFKLCGPHFPNVVICLRKSDPIKPIDSVVPYKFRNLLLVIHSNCVEPVFQGGNLCVIMEKGPYKTHYLSGLVHIPEILAFSPVKLCAPLFPRWTFVSHGLRPAAFVYSAYVSYLWPYSVLYMSMKKRLNTPNLLPS